jgi:outer membrane protein OmpA-like peptidoglycan-associated protein
VRRNFLVSIFLLFCLIESSFCAAATDPTTALKLSPGMTIMFPIREGIDSKRKPLGDYQFNVRVVEAGNGFKYDWEMGGAANASGTRSVTAQDQKAALSVSLFYDQKRDGTILGSTNIVRVSDAVYRSLKAGNTIGFRVDGPEGGITPRGRRDPVILPTSLAAVGEEQVYIRLNGKRVLVRSIKTQTDNGWNYWILDNPQFPVMVAGAGPFYWDEPSFTLGKADADEDKARNDREARKVTKDLQDKGEATTYAILFAFDSDKLTDNSKKILQTIGEFLTANPTMRLEIQGHTDNVGGFDYNMDLSRRRAESVQKFLVENCKIAASRFVAHGFGFTVPVADNATAKGRALNRRVVFKRL